MLTVTVENHRITPEQAREAAAALERDGLVDRTVTPSVPPRVDYALTPLGQSLRGPVALLGDWAVANREAVAQARSEYDLREDG